MNVPATITRHILLVSIDVFTKLTVHSPQVILTAAKQIHDWGDHRSLMAQYMAAVSKNVSMKAHIVKNRSGGVT